MGVFKNDALERIKIQINDRKKMWYHRDFSRKNQTFLWWRGHFVLQIFYPEWVCSRTKRRKSLNWIVTEEISIKNAKRFSYNDEEQYEYTPEIIRVRTDHENGDLRSDQDH